MKLSQKQIILLISAALVITTLIAYEPVRHNGFVIFDDPEYIIDNPNINNGITLQSITWAFTHPHYYMWHPLTTLTNMLDCELFGLNPLGHHSVSILLHIANALLLFWILTNITGTTWASAFIAAVFALHPLQVESVAWAAERKTVLSGLFWLLTLAVYIRYTRKPGFGRYLLVLLVFGLCIMTKPTVVTLPFVLLLLDYWPLERIRQGQSAATSKSAIWLIAEKIPLLGMSAFLSLMTITSQRSGGLVISLQRLPLPPRIANAFTSYIHYIGKMLWPSRLAVLYTDLHINLLDTIVIISIVLFVLITAISILTGRRRKYAAIGWLWYIGTLVPMIGLVQSFWQAMANRYMYIPIIGLLIIVTWLVRDAVIIRPRLKVVVVFLACAVLTTLIILTRNQVKHWENSLTLFEYTLKVTENNGLAEYDYGRSLSEKGRLDEAEIHFKTALRMFPLFDDARINLGKVYVQQGKINEAVACFNDVLMRNDKSAATHYFMALALVMQNKFNEAIIHLNKVLKLEPYYPDARKKLALSLVATGQLDEAVASFNELLQKNKNSEEIHYNLAVALGMQKKYDEAIKHLARVLELDPNYPDARNKMALALTAIGRLDEAVSCFNALLKYQKDSAEIHYRLAVVLGKQKKYDEAIEHLAKVLQLNPMYPEAHNKIGFAFMQTGKYDLAIENFTRAIELNPGNIDVLNKLAWLLAAVDDASIHNAQKAVEFAQRGCELTGYNDPMLLDTLAVAYAAAGKFEEAKATAEKALNIAKETGRENFAGEIQNRIKLYQANQQYRQK